MNKRISCLALSFLLVLSLMTAPATAVEATSQEETRCRCGCGQYLQNITWQPWGFTEGNAETGHYYLAENFSAQTDTITIPAFKNVCLDLRGKIYETESIRAFSLEGVFSVMDTVGGGLILTTGKNNTSAGFAYVSSIGELNIFGGTIRFTEREDIVVPAGGLIYVRSGKLNIYGGTVVGGVVRPDADTNAQGGNIYVNGGTMTMTGGTVTGGMALANENSTMTAYQGGNIYAVGGGTVEISGGTVSEGYCQQDGGNIYVAGADLTVSGSAVIRDGHALRNGGNIQQLTTGVNSVTISGGTITGGVAGGIPINTTTWDDTKGNFSETRGTGGGGNLYVRSAKGSLTVSGGSIDGDIKVDSIQSLTLSGSPVIGLGKANGLMLASGIRADVTGLTGGEIYVYASHVFTGENAENALPYFKGAVRTGLSLEGTALKGTQGTQGYCPHCGQLVTWTACYWKDVSDLTAQTHCYMKGTSLSAETIAAPIVVDMNGMTFGKEHAQQLVSSTGSLTFLDSWGGGQLIGTGSTSGISWGGVLRVNDTNFTLYSGTVRRVEPFSASYKGKATRCYIGGVLFASGTASVYLQGGVIRDGIANQKYSSYAGAFGGNIGFNSGNGVFTMSAGLVLGGTASDVTVDTTTHQGQGGNLYTPGKTTVSLSGGFLLEGNASVGGNICASVVLNMTGGTVAWGTGINGGNISAARAFAMTGGTVTGGKAECGGNLYFGAYTANRSLTGGAVTNGKATTGGNIYQSGTTSAKGTLEIKNTAVLCGDALAAGNIYTAYGALDVADGTLVCGGIASGTAANESGGNILATGAEMTVSGTVTTGTTTQRGGNIYALGGTQLTVNTGAVITDGTAAVYGGNIAVGSASTVVTLEGGSLYGGSARNAGSNICLLGSPALVLQNVTIPGGIYGDSGTVTLSGSATVTGGSAYDLFFKNGKLLIGDSWTGTAGVKWSAVTFHYGEAVPETYVDCGSFTGELLYDGLSTRPGLLGRDGKLTVGTTALYNGAGEAQWFASPAAAVTAWDQNTEYMKLMTGDALVLTGGSYVIDLAGQSVTVTGTGTVSCIDSSNDTYDAALCGTATILGPVLSEDKVTQVQGKQYVAVEKEGSYSFHRLELGITGVALRPSCAGLYYQGTWQYDEVLSGMIDAYGIGVSTGDIPDTDLLTDPDTLYTQNSGNSVLVENILTGTSSAMENAQRGEMPVFAAAYVRFADGTVCVGHNTGVYSLHSFLEAADRLIGEDRITYRTAEKSLQSFYGDWQDRGIGNWQFTSIKAPVAPDEDNVMKILMIGQSHAQDTVWMLYDVLKAEMPDKEFLVMDVYRSTNLDEHVQNIKNRAALYDCYENSSGKVVHTPNVTITDMIMRENWDLIVFNEAAWNQTQEEQYHDGDFEFMIDHIRRYAAPGYKLGYNATWAQPVTKLLYAADRRPAPASFRNQFTTYFGGDRLAHFAQISKMMETYIEPNEAFDFVFHSGTAIQYASEVHGVPEAVEDRNYELYRDYTHLSDFGRLMVAYQWYAQIFGLEELTEVKVNLIPASMRATSREQAYGDILITDMHKEAIIASVNYALQNPNKAPTDTIRDTAILESLS